MWLAALGLLVSTRLMAAVDPRLETGVAVHAFDHLGNLGHQAEAAAASGATVIYATGVGGVGYSGLPEKNALKQLISEESSYAQRAHRLGVNVVLGYVCATSIVGLESFDRNWPPELRSVFSGPPAGWRQQGRDGRPLPSWYGGAYEPACMNNPDWRSYERHIVRLQLDSGHDGIFFDNPTVHPKGCYCPHCMAGFAMFLESKEGLSVPDRSLEAMRWLADNHAAAFARYRCTIARDFLQEMRRYARSIRPRALITANNSLNASDVLYAQCASYAYNLAEMSRGEDFVVVEDMSSQPRILPDGRAIEYGPTYRQVHALIHGLPLVAVTIAEGDYHTPPNLVRLAMAEAAANDASYLSWPTWPEDQRQRMFEATRSQAEFQREHASLLQGTRARSDVALFLPFRRWLETNRCTVSALAGELSRANIPYTVIADEDFAGEKIAASRVLLAERRSDFDAGELAVVERFERVGGRVVTADEGVQWLDRVRVALGSPSAEIAGAPTVRLTVRDQGRRAIAHLLNLNVRRVSSFEDVVTPATNLVVRVRTDFQVRSVRALTADEHGTKGKLRFTLESIGGTGGEKRRADRGRVVEVQLPRVDIATLLVFE